MSRSLAPSNRSRVWQALSSSACRFVGLIQFSQRHTQQVLEPCHDQWIADHFAFELPCRLDQPLAQQLARRQALFFRDNRIEVCEYLRENRRSLLDLGQPSLEVFFRGLLPLCSARPPLSVPAQHATSPSVVPTMPPTSASKTRRDRQDRPLVPAHELPQADSRADGGQACTGSSAR